MLITANKTQRAIALVDQEPDLLADETAFAVVARGLADEVTQTIRVVPRGFPFEVSAAGTAVGGQVARETLDLTGALPGSFTATVTMYPSPLASMTKGMEGMIREPGGCFEQTSSSNYPNVMVLAYMASSDDADPALIEQSQAVLDKGYGLLTGYETKQRGYEWFGQTPGHEALTAYGLMEFADMAKVYDVDAQMVERTAAWLMERRDGQGGFSRSSTALDSFGRAGADTTNAYIMWALAEAGRADGLTAELKVQRALAAATRDPYLLALAAFALEWAAARRLEPVGAPAAVLVGTEGAPIEGAEAVSDSDAADQKTQVRVDMFGRMGLALTVIGWGLHLSGVVARGIAANRFPWGNMYEFVTAALLFVVTAYLVLALRGVRWLGLPVTLLVRAG